MRVARQIERFHLVRGRGEDADLEYGVAGGDFVAVGHLGRLNANAVEQGSAAAVQVDQPAARRIHFDQEVPARKIGIVVGKLEVGVLGPADEEGVVPVEYELPALMRSRDDGQFELHEVVLKLGCSAPASSCFQSCFTTSRALPGSGL